MKKYFLAFTAIIIFTSSIFSQDFRATTEKGRSVILKKTGIWFFADRSQLEEGKAVIYDGRAVKLGKDGKWTFLNNKQPAAVPTHMYSRTTSTAVLNNSAGSFIGKNFHPFLSSNAVEIANANSTMVDQNRFTTKQYVLVYFSAHWCGPCRRFTPDLVRFYNENGGGSKFEIVFVSDDYGPQEMMNYMREVQMPWIGVRWKSNGAVAISNKYSGSGIPCLVLLNGNDEVISHSYVNGEYVGPRKVLGDLENILKQ